MLKTHQAGRPDGYRQLKFWLTASVPLPEESILEVRVLSRDIEIICSGILCIASLIGFGYSLIRFFRSSNPGYPSFGILLVINESPDAINFVFPMLYSFPAFRPMSVYQIRSRSTNYGPPGQSPGSTLT